MKRLLILGVALSSMGNLTQCPAFNLPDGEPRSCDNIVVETPPGSCFELRVDPCTHRPWTSDTGIALSPRSNDVSLDWTADETVVTRRLCVQASIPTQTAYHYTYFDHSHAVGQGEFLVTAISGLTLAMSATPATINPGQSSQLAVTVSGGIGPYNYAWDYDPTLSASLSASALARPTATTTYRVTVIDGAGHSGQATITVQVATIGAPSSVVLQASPAIVDSGGTTRLSVTTTNMTPPLDIQWRADVALLPTQNPAQVDTTALANTTSATATVTDRDGHVVSVTIEVPVRLTVSASAVPTSVIAGQTVQLSASAVGGDGHYHYVWIAPPSVAVSNLTVRNPTTTPSTTTTYSVSVFDERGQAAGADVTVTVMPAPALAASFISRQPGTALPFDVTLDGSASTGNIVSYEWDLSWTTGAPDFITTGPIATFTRTQESLRGTITLTVRDASGNTATASRSYP